MSTKDIEQSEMRLVLIYPSQEIRIRKITLRSLLARIAQLVREGSSD
jgi:hypothetical protein